MRIGVVEAYTLNPIKYNLDDNNAMEKILGHCEATKLLDDDLFSETVKSITEPITLKHQHQRDSVLFGKQRDTTTTRTILTAGKVSIP